MIVLGTLTFISLTLLVKYPEEKKEPNFLQRIKINMAYSFFIRLIDESWLLTTTSSIINLQKADKESRETIGVCFSIVFLTVYFLFIPFSGLIVFKNQGELENLKF